MAEDSLSNQCNLTPENPPKIPLTEEEVPPGSRSSTVGISTLSDSDIKCLEDKQRIDNNKSNQDLARKLIKWLLVGAGVMCIVFALMSTFDGKYVNLFEKVFVVVQSALFTLLGYLFGKKSSNE